MQLFFFFENLTLYYWTSTAVRPQHYLTFWPAEAATLLSKTLKLELHLAASTLIEASVIDTLAYTPTILEFDQFLRKNRYLSFYIFYLYQLKSRLTVCFSHSVALLSLEAAFPNANWLEREFSELYGVKVGAKKDQRNLLLDYTATYSPMQKGFPCAGEEEVFYNPLEEAIVYYPNTSVEL